MTDRGPSLVLGSRGQSAQTGHYFYVHNTGIVGDHASQARLVLNENKGDFQEDRLMHRDLWTV